MGESVASDVPLRPPAGGFPPGSPRPGRYRHHKGAEYRVLGCVRHSETEEWLVLYRALYAERGLWVRPLEMFTDTVEKGGRAVARFALVEAETDGRDGA